MNKHKTKKEHFFSFHSKLFIIPFKKLRQVLNLEIGRKPEEEENQVFYLDSYHIIGVASCRGKFLREVGVDIFFPKVSLYS